MLERLACIFFLSLGLFTDSERVESVRTLKVSTRAKQLEWRAKGRDPLSTNIAVKRWARRKGGGGRQAGRQGRKNYTVPGAVLIRGNSSSSSSGGSSTCSSRHSEPISPSNDLLLDILCSMVETKKLFLLPLFCGWRVVFLFSPFFFLFVLL